jgi:hypothetical protein
LAWDGRGGVPVRHDALVIGSAVLFGVFVTAAGTYAFLRYLFGDVRP